MWLAWVLVAMSVLRFATAGIFMVALAAPLGLAQSPTSENIRGSAKGLVVKAADGQPIAQARVDFLLPTTGLTRTTHTGTDGKFSFDGLSPAVYQVAVTAPAYESLQLVVSVEDGAGSLLLRLRHTEHGATPINDNVVSLQELRMAGKAENPFSKGTNLLLKGDARRSLPYFQAALAKDPGYFRAHHNLGLAYYQLGRLELAVAEFQKAIDLTQGGYAPSDFALAMLLCEEQRFPDAERLVENGLAMQPDSAMGHYFLGLVQFGRRQFAEAEQSARDALKENGDQADAYILLARIHERENKPYAVMTDIEAYFVAEPSGPLRDEANELLRKAKRQIEKDGAAAP